MKKRERKSWYKLDNAGKLYPSIVSTRMSTVFRMSIKLSEDVDPKILQSALSKIINRFPYFKVNLHRGLFWYYFEYTEKTPKVKRETYYPCMFMKYKSKKTFPFRILYYGKYISAEFSHSICDGYGAIIFMKTLIIQYFKLKKGIHCKDLSGAIDLHAHVDNEEYEDAFKKYYKKGIPLPKRLAPAVHFPFPLIEKGKYLILTGIVPSSHIKDIAKSYQCSVTQLIIAIYFEVIQEYVLSLNGKEKDKMLGRVVMNVPVDLRKLYPSKTLRNFFITITPEIDLRLGQYSLTELIEYVKNYMILNINEKNINRYISRNVQNEKKLLIRMIPLSIKNLLMPAIYSHFGERGFTSSISNLGIIKMPEELNTLIESIEIVPPPSVENKIKLVMLTYSEKLILCFGSTTYNTEIEKLFFRKLRKMGIPVKLETNME